MSWQTSLIEFGIILIIGAVIGGFLYYSIENTSIHSDMKIVVPLDWFFCNTFNLLWINQSQCQCR